MEKQKQTEPEKMSPEAREKYRQYQRSYRRRNRQKVAQWNRAYWERLAQKDRDSRKAEE